MTLDDAVKKLVDLKKEVPGNTELLDADGFAIVDFNRWDVEEDNKVLNVKKGEVLVFVNSLR